MKLLMVDDEATILLFYKAELSDEGYEVITATNAEKALDLFIMEKPDAVTLDIVMPEIKSGILMASPDPIGIQLLLKMKEINKKVPVIMLTAYDYSDKMTGLPSDGFIMKSTDTTELKQTLSALLTRN